LYGCFNLSQTANKNKTITDLSWLTVLVDCIVTC